MNKLILATNNRGKSLEIKNIFSGLPVKVYDLADIGIDIHIEESGKTYSENALVKAKKIFDLVGAPTIADDSGLEVDLLCGRPGIYSARYAPDTKMRIHKLLNELKGVKMEFRTARFICVACLYSKGGNYNLFEGRVEGLITEEPRGENGFGFDPVFLLPELGKTMAELPPDIKNSTSHRAMAFTKLKDFLRHYWQW